MRIDAAGLHDTLDAAIDGGAHDVVAADRVVVVQHAVVQVGTRVGDGAQVDHAIKRAVARRHVKQSVDVGDARELGGEEGDAGREDDGGRRGVDVRGHDGVALFD